MTKKNAIIYFSDCVNGEVSDAIFKARSDG